MYTLEISFNPNPLKRKQRGLGLLLAILTSALILSLLSVLTRLTLCGLMTEKAQLQYLDAFYRAEAGVEYAKDKLSEDPGWYTDRSHLPSHDKAWLKESAWGFYPLNNCKVVKEKNKNRVYAMGKSSANPVAQVILYCEYTFPPLKITKWEEL